MREKVRNYFYLAITMVIAYFIGSSIFNYLVDPILTPVIGMRPVLAAITVGIFAIGGYKLLASRYKF